MKYDYNDVKHLDELARFLFHNPNNYLCGLSDYPHITDKTVFFHNKFLLEKFNTNELEICMLDIYQHRKRGEIERYYGGHIVYEIISTSMKLDVTIKQFDINGPIAIGLYVKEVNDCKYWKWQFYE